MDSTQCFAESTTTCEAGGPDFWPSAEKIKMDGSTFCVELASGCNAPGFYGKNNLPVKMKLASGSALSI
jgi:hypothetical protein